MRQLVFENFLWNWRRIGSTRRSTHVVKVPCPKHQQQVEDVKISFVGILDYYVAFVISSHISLNPVNAVGGYGEVAASPVAHLTSSSYSVFSSTQLKSTATETSNRVAGFESGMHCSETFRHRRGWNCVIPSREGGTGGPGGHRGSFDAFLPLLPNLCWYREEVQTNQLSLCLSKLLDSSAVPDIGI